jgi:hypothetical protein
MPLPRFRRAPAASCRKALLALPAATAHGSARATGAAGCTLAPRAPAAAGVVLTALAALAALIGMAAAPCQAAPVEVIDMIPQAMSDESNRDSEPFLAVDPANPQHFAATAFMRTPMGSPNGPLLVSTDNGSTWIASNIIPSSAGASLNTGDITIQFDSSGGAFYAGILRIPDFYHLQVLRTTDTTLATPLDILEGRFNVDQPYTAARTVTGWYDPGKDRLWVGSHDFGADPQGATVDESLDALAGGPTFTQPRLDQMPALQDSYQTRVAAHPDGHVYAAFYRRTTATGTGFNGDVVVVREDNWGKTMPPFQSLSHNVAAGVPVTIDFSGAFGHEIIGGDLFLTVDPNDSSQVYVSWAQKDGADPMTLHLSRSPDGGTTWNQLLTVPSAKNAAVAINSQGRIAYLYQQLTGGAGSRHWQTHLRRSNDGVVWDDVMLSDFPAEGAGSPGGSRIIGDYLRILAVGKNFHGVFSAYNDLVNASFPAGVTFQRNKTAPGVMPPSFLGVDGVTPVASSIDPFFFRTTEMEPVQDVYVRDWTDSAAVHDQGQEPSTRADFYSTSDVWNERGNDPLAFDANDRPQVHDPQPAAMGPNYAFARISRNATGTPLDVKVEYFYSDGGVGVPYVSAGPPTTIHLAAGDASQTPAVGSGYPWSLPSGASNHVCLAAQISTPADPYIQPSLSGKAPGWPTTDLMIVADNNKAQRNMQVFGLGGMSAGQELAQGAAYAIACNAASSTRDMAIGLTVDPRRMQELGPATVRVLGGPGPEPQRVTPGAVLTLPRVVPAECRWLELAFSPSPALKEPLAVTINELVGARAVNGYAFVVRPMALQAALREALFQHAAVFTRLAAGFAIAGGEAQAKLAQGLLRAKGLEPGTYAKFLATQARAVATLTAALVKKGGSSGDPFGAAAATKALAGAPTDPAAAEVIHLTLLNKLDATATFYQRAAAAAARRSKR